jgi:transcriptional regulator with XRE-family HTH domain
MGTESGPNLGHRLRELRTQNRWRIADVSRLTGLAASTISKVENGRMSLTYDKLQQLANGLSLDLADLFRDRTRVDPPKMGAARRSVERSGEGALIDVGFYEYRFLNVDLAPKQMVPIVGEVKARSLEEFGKLIEHLGEEFLFVLEGSVVVHSDFYAPVTLNVGDHLYIDSRMGHAYLAGSEGTCRVLVVCTGAQTEELQQAVHASRSAKSEQPRQGRVRGGASDDQPSTRRKQRR